ncbi:MAG: hypothetical protein M1814_000711 [Vezdaea aestivalis]|nr:MAG: hypothetical protein M1814_000711 [Vezdaea aestivalis]
MPLPILAEGLFNGLSAIPYSSPILRTLPWFAGSYVLKTYLNGTVNRSERNMHSKVVMITGGTAGIGASVAFGLAKRGAQIILLTREPPTDPFLVDYIEALRNDTDNDLIYAEQMNMSSLHSIRQFATKWIDNSPPRRIDLIILCAASMKPRLSAVTLTEEGAEETWAVNYLGNFHLLSILSPAIRAQPAERDVRIIMGTCASYMGGKIDPEVKARTKSFNGGQAYADSKMALMAFAQSFQKHLDAYERPDKQPNGARVVLVDPGWARTPGMRRWLTMGTLWGLLLYVLTWPLWWLLLKSPDQGSQSFLTAAMASELGTKTGGRLIKECREIRFLKPEVTDEKLAERLWKASENQIQKLEKEGAVRRAAIKKEKSEKEEQTKTQAKQPSSLSPSNSVSPQKKVGG